jgi:hypothetical protein
MLFPLLKAMTYGDPLTAGCDPEAMYRNLRVNQ